MSRYSLAPRDDASLDVVVGWDAPLSTFFVHVIRPGPEDNFEIEDEYILMTGNRLYEVPDINRVEESVSPFADLPENIKQKLISDSQTPYQRSAFQEWAIKNGLVQ